MQKKQINVFYPESPADWREWLVENHRSEDAVWLVFHTKGSGKKTLSWSEAVDVALCFGWIDSKKIKIDDETSHQFFSKRKAKSTWSKINKQKVEMLHEKGLMTEAGYKCIEIAKQNGSWSLLDSVDELVIPKDLEEEFQSKPDVKDFFLGLSKSAKKLILLKLVLAKQPETRQKRIKEVVTLAYSKQKPGPLN